MTLSAIIILIVVVLAMALGAFSAAPWVPTRRGERDILLGSFDFREGEKVYDLGSGHGTVLFAIKDRYPGIRGVGVEIAPIPHMIASLRNLFRRKARLRFVLGDLFGEDLRDADTVFVFLLSKCYPRLMRKFAKELKDDCRVVVMAWPFEGMEPVRHIKTERTLRVLEYRGRQFRDM